MGMKRTFRAQHYRTAAGSISRACFSTVQTGPDFFLSYGREKPSLKAKKPVLEEEPHSDSFGEEGAGKMATKMYKQGPKLNSKALTYWAHRNSQDSTSSVVDEPALQTLPWASYRAIVRGNNRLRVLVQVSESVHNKMLQVLVQLD